MPLLVAPLFALSLGLFLGTRRAGSFGARGVRAAQRCIATLALLGLLPAFAFPALYRPAWAWLHIVDPARVPSFINLLLAGGSAALVIVGHKLGDLTARSAAAAAPDGRTPSPSGGTSVALIPLAFALAIVIVLHKRVLIVEPARRNVDPVTLFGSRFILALLVIDAMMIAAIVLTQRALDELVDPGTDTLVGHRLGARGRHK